VPVIPENGSLDFVKAAAVYLSVHDSPVKDSDSHSVPAL